MAGAFNLGAAKATIIFDDSQYVKGVKNVKTQNQKMGKSFNVMGLAASAAAAAIVAGLVSSIKKANEFQKAFANVRTLIDETKVNTKAMQKELLNLDARLGSSIELTKGLYQALSAGVEPAKAVKFVGEAAKFAKAALVDTFNAVDVLTTVLNAYGLEAKEATRVSDVLFQTIKLGKITGQELASSLGKVIPTASTLGVEVEDLGAAIAVMTKQGIRSFEAVTQLQALFNAFIKPSGEMVKKFQELGIESGSVLAKTEGLAGMLKFLQDATGGNIEQMGKLLPNVRALKGALSLTGEQAKNFSDTLMQMENAGGSTEEAFKKQELTFETLSNQVEKLQIKIGNAFLPVLFQMTNGLTELTKAAQIIAPVIQIFIDAISVAVEGIGPEFGKIINEISRGFKELTGGLVKNNIIFTSLAAIMKVININFTVGLKVVGAFVRLIVDLIIISKDAINTLVTLGKAIFQPKKWKEVGQEVKNLGGSIKKLALDSIADWSDIVTTVVTEFAKLPETAKTQATNWQKIWDDALKQVSNTAKTTIEEINDSAQDIGAGLEFPIMTLRQKWNTLNKNMQDKWDNTISGIADSAAWGLGVIKDLFNEISGVIIEAQEIELEALVASNEEKILAAEERKELELASLQDQKERGLLTEEQFAAKQAALESQRNEEIKKLKKEALEKENAKKKQIFDAKKANEIANIWIQFALGTVGAFAQGIAQLGPVAGAIAGGVATAALLAVATAQTIVIGQQQFIPEKARGGRVSGPAIMNEEGPEAVHLPDGSIVVPADITAAAIGAAGMATGGMQVNVSFAGAKIADDMSLQKITKHVVRELGKQLRVSRGGD
jgi:TP901 family phage tail tape measure protein